LAALLSHQPVPGSGAGPNWLDAIRSQGRASFLRGGGLPTRRSEEWRYTDLTRLRERRFRPAAAADAAQSVDLLPSLIAGKQRLARLVCVNGQLRADLSLMPNAGSGVTVQSLAATLADDASGWLRHSLDAADWLHRLPMLALNTALCQDVLLIAVEPGRHPEGWVEVVSVGGSTDPVLVAPRLVVSVGEAGGLDLLENHVSLPAADYLAAPAIQVTVAAAATLRHCRVMAAATRASHLLTTLVECSADSRYQQTSVALSGGLNRLETHVQLSGAGAACGLSGAYIVRGTDICDHTTFVRHQQAKTASRQVFKGVIDQAGHAVFQGRVTVDRAASQADGHQLSKALLLSDAAQIDQKPALEIYADDVKCSHGAAAGHLDEGALFYLRSRGLPQATAQTLLLEGFLADPLQELSDEALRAVLHAQIAGALANDGGSL
jgi:Fe-S cluster assembly protein SufD